MGSTFQYLTGLNALKQLGIPYRQTDNAALAVFHLQNIRKSFQALDGSPDTYFLAKSHAAFPEQVEAVLSAKNSRVFLVWRDQRDSLVSDFHFSQRRGGHVYGGFDDYFRRRGRKILLRNCLQKLSWQQIDDPRVRAWDYLDLVDNFEQAAGEMMNFAGLCGVDIEALKQSVSIEQLRRTKKDPQGAFFRKGGKQNLGELNPGPDSLKTIEEIMGETDVQKIAADFEREDWMRIMLFGRECREAGARKAVHWGLHQANGIRYLRRNVLPGLYKFSPRRLIGSKRAT